MNSIKKSVNRITIKDKTIRDQNKILDELKSFYKNLLTTKHTANEMARQFINVNMNKKLSNADQKDLIQSHLVETNDE